MTPELKPEFQYDNPNALEVMMWMYLTYGTRNCSIGITDGYVTSAVDRDQGYKLYRDDDGNWAIKRMIPCEI